MSGEAAHHPGRLGVLAHRVRAGVRWIGWYVREVSGETAYEKYAAHVRRHDPVAEVMTRRQFERSRMDAREADPRDGFRCC
ncbi:YbdD/YjiX family protein [Streptomyces albidoflavus]|uniref:YbdD/YjiX family protein n=1 Tax=Streptomyces sp. NRRL F-6628 TaxID=1463876 RepID=UPI00056882AA|nr:YbdD/YjiX family protein [Streptomyces sp. NRRL F-6628]